MKYLKGSIVIVIFISLLVSIVSIQEAQAATRKRTNKEMEVVADPIMDNILDGVKLENYVAYSKDFDKALKIIGSRTKFFQVARYLKKSLGNYLYREYMGSIYKDNGVVVLWKGTFDKSQNDVLIKLFLSKQNNRYVVTGVRFQ